MLRALCVLVVIAGCAKSGQPLPPESWTTEDYARVGISIDKPWAPADFARARDVLVRETAGHRDRLPRYRGIKSGSVFAHLTAVPIDDPPSTERLPEYLEIYEAINAISKLYFVDLAAAPPREYIELVGSLLRLAAQMSAVSEAYVASFGPDDPKRQLRIDGLAKMRRGFGNMMLGGLQSAGDSRVPDVDRIALLGHVTTALATLFPKATPEAQRDIRAQIDRLVDGLPKGELHDAALAAKAALP